MNENYKCSHCNDTGWKTVIKDDRQLVQRCACLKQDVLIASLEKANIPRRYAGCTLETYFTDKRYPTLSVAKNTVKNIIDDFPAVLVGLLLQGACGTGKTRLMCSVATELLKKHPSTSIQYCNWMELVKDSRNIEKDNNTFNRLLSTLANVDVLLFDELGGSIPTAWFFDNIYYLLDKRYSEQRLTLFATNFFDEGTEGNRLVDRVGERIRSRIYEMTTALIIKSEDFRRL